MVSGVGFQVSAPPLAAKSRVGLCARRIRIIANPGIRSAQRPTLLDCGMKLTLDFMKFHTRNEKHKI
jgi:hypothetical protein